MRHKRGGGNSWPSKFLWVVVFCCLLQPAFAQTLWSEVQLSKRRAYVGEPVQVTVRVYTSTWFTKGVDPGNIKVNGAYTVFFRNVSTSTSRNGKTYPGVEMIYHVFPFANKDVRFPAVEIAVESPADGGYKGKPHTVTTKERVIEVRPIPPGFDMSSWLVSSDLSVRQEWSADLKDVKVGDVIQRRIIRNADNTVPQLIPPVAWDSLPGVSQYPGRSDVQNIRTKTAIGAVRTEVTRYLFEKQGEVEIPEMVFTWWNPRQQQLYKRTLPSVKVLVKPNPDLGMLETLKDSLLTAQKAEVSAAEEKAPLTFLGLSPEKLVAIIVLMAISFYFLMKFLPRLVKRYQEKRQRYLRSEPYFFDQFKRAAKNGESKKGLNALYRWIDQLGLQEPTLQYFAEGWGSPGLKHYVRQWSRVDGKDLKLDEDFVKELSVSREIFLNASGEIPSALTEAIWINP
ncbi:BatD family protein [Echinicola soli]|uniref:BatD family protein n=1 Tax=Echinicola soli TaxID=2591634 RepID=UPI001E4F4A7A|nr:BatD family protein [Echinicola soli]